MNQISPTLSRRFLLQAGSALLVGISAAPALPGHAAAAAAGAVRPPLTPDQLDSFIALQPDGRFVAFYGKMDPGQGVDVAIAQIVAEELDVPAAAVRVVQGDTAQNREPGRCLRQHGGGEGRRHAALRRRRGPPGVDGARRPQARRGSRRRPRPVGDGERRGLPPVRSGASRRLRRPDR